MVYLRLRHFCYVPFPTFSVGNTLLQNRSRSKCPAFPVPRRCCVAADPICGDQKVGHEVNMNSALCCGEGGSAGCGCGATTYQRPLDACRNLNCGVVSSEESIDIRWTARKKTNREMTMTRKNCAGACHEARTGDCQMQDTCLNYRGGKNGTFPQVKAGHDSDECCLHSTLVQNIQKLGRK